MKQSLMRHARQARGRRVRQIDSAWSFCGFRILSAIMARAKCFRARAACLAMASGSDSSAPTAPGSRRSYGCSPASTFRMAGRSLARKACGSDTSRKASPTKPSRRCSSSSTRRSRNARRKCGRCATRRCASCSRPLDLRQRITIVRCARFPAASGPKRRSRIS